MKNNKGITLIVLVITIIVTLIIGSIGVYASMNSVNHSRLIKFVSYMQIIQKKVDEMITNEDDYSTLGYTINASGKKADIVNVLAVAYAKEEIQTQYTEGTINNYRYFDKAKLSTDLLLDNIEDEIIINFETREVISLTGIEYNKNSYSGSYYTQYLLPTGQKIVHQSAEETRTLNFTATKNITGLSATIEIQNISITNGTLAYKEQGKEWNYITNYTQIGRTEVLNISKSGTYILKLTDNTKRTNTREETINMVLSNPPILTEGLTFVKQTYDYSEGIINSTYGAVATNEIQQYVWVPRFAYKRNLDNSITKEFIKGISTITTYNNQIDNTWTIPEEFSNQEGLGYLEKTGIWMIESEINNLLS